ncbi:MAG: alpha/beta fold hydrolase [Bacteroidetes bacterium]|nr:alpha/beta fold hydrolase [Bacteroidota bacterium]
MPPDWLDPALYPFAPHFCYTDAGRMHYVDEGDGPPVVLLHGNPTWSFLYRRLIRDLSPNYRCVAPDYIGFGRSAKPADATYAPSAQAARVEALITQLGLQDITLIVHDWGGPIGLSYALRHPARVRRLVIANSWMWPLHDDAWVSLFSRLAGSPLGRLLITRYNAFARVILPLAFADRSRLSQRAFRHYLAPLATPSDRMGSWAFPRALRSETTWLGSLWRRRAALKALPLLIVWGLRDPAFGMRHLQRWADAFPHARIHPLPDVGHYVPEEASATFARFVQIFLDDTAHSVRS